MTFIVLPLAFIYPWEPQTSQDLFCYFGPCLEMRGCVWCPHSGSPRDLPLILKRDKTPFFSAYYLSPAYSFFLLFWTFIKSLLADSLIAKPLCPELQSKHRPGTVYVDCVEGCLQLSVYDTPVFLWGVIAIKLRRRTETNREEKRGMQGGKCH